MTDTLIVQLIPPISGTDDDEQDAINCAAQWLHLSSEATPDTLNLRNRGTVPVTATTAR